MPTYDTVRPMHFSHFNLDFWSTPDARKRRALSQTAPEQVDSFLKEHKLSPHAPIQDGIAIPIGRMSTIYQQNFYENQCKLRIEKGRYIPSDCPVAQEPDDDLLKNILMGSNLPLDVVNMEADPALKQFVNTDPQVEALRQQLQTGQINHTSTPEKESAFLNQFIKAINSPYQRGDNKPDRQGQPYVDLASNVLWGHRRVSLGETLQAGIGVCRHKSLLAKVVMDHIGFNQGIQTSYQVGHVGFPKRDGSFHPTGMHAWNHITMPSRRKYLVDVRGRQIIPKKELLQGHPVRNWTWLKHLQAQQNQLFQKHQALEQNHIKMQKALQPHAFLKIAPNYEVQEKHLTTLTQSIQQRIEQTISDINQELMYVESYGQNKIIKDVEALIKAGKVNQPNMQDNELPLHWVIDNLPICNNEDENYKVPLVQRLIAAGADVNRPNQYAQSPLELAIETGESHLIPMLIQAGADVTKPGIYNALAARPELISSILPHVNQPVIREELLQLAIESGEIQDLPEESRN